MRPAGSPQALQRRRERAMQLLDEGYQPHEVASMVKADRRSVRRWRAACRQQGTQALQARPAPGRPSKLTDGDKARLEELLLKGAVAAGYPTDLWTCARIAETITAQFGVQYHTDHIGRLMRALGWSVQKPTRRALERDEAAIATWVRTDWPRVKKTPHA